MSGSRVLPSGWKLCSRVMLCALSLVVPLSPPSSAAGQAEQAEQVGTQESDDDATVTTTEAPGTGQPPSTFDDIWKFANWYENDDNAVIQSLQFSGRFQLDYAAVDADQGHHTEWNIRRFRFGAKARLFGKFTLHGEVELNPQEADPVYTRITDLYFQWNKSARFEATIGKHSAPFTMDGATSSKELLAIDRSNLANNIWFTQEYFPGLSGSGELGRWAYHAGIYSSGSANREFGEFDGSAFGLVVVGYDFAERLHVEEAVLAANYVRARLEGAYHLPYTGRSMHEVVFSDRDLAGGCATLDVAKSLIDRGFHPPTIYFPLVVRGALMIEPTETESKEVLDEFCDAMLEIARHAAEDPRQLKDAPVRAKVRRLDEAAAARKPVLRWTPES